MLSFLLSLNMAFLLSYVWLYDDAYGCERNKCGDRSSPRRASSILGQMADNG
jgi:hypothetical protein